MGVRGLTTFIAYRSDQYFENYELHDTYLVIDGNNISSHLYKWHCKKNDCFGGDYDKYAKLIYEFFDLLSQANVKPLIIFDGGYEKKKLKTIYDRMAARIEMVKNFDSTYEGNTSIFPLFLRDMFVDIVVKLNLPCVRCEYEADNETASLARALECPVLSYDSDFFIFDTLYIPFNTLKLKINKNKKGVKYIQCQVYSIEKFLSFYNGLQKEHLPLIAILLGNDYVKKSLFSVFYKHLKLPKNRKLNERKNHIRTIIKWLQNESFESAIQKILTKFKLHRRQMVAGKMQKLMDTYLCCESVLLNYFGLEPKTKEIRRICIEDIPLNEREEGIFDDLDMTDFEEEIHYNPADDFQENFRKALLPSSFIDILNNFYFCMCQIEDCSYEPSHNISLDLLTVIHKILTQPNRKKLICVTRNNDCNMVRLYLPQSKMNLPNVREIGLMSKDDRKLLFLKILNVSKNLATVPDLWDLYILCMKYWILNSATKIHISYVYAIFLCGIVLNYIDKQLGFYRSSRQFTKKFAKDLEKNQGNDNENDEILNYDCSVRCMDKLVYYFQMDAKMKENGKLFDKNRYIIHKLAEFQSCLLHIKYLNSLLKCPFTPFIISDFYDGTFLFSMTSNLIKRTNTSDYIKLLLQDSPTVLNLLEIFMNSLNDVQEFLDVNPQGKRRKRKRKLKMSDEEIEEEVVELSDNGIVDENNMYAVLSNSKV